MRIIEVLADRLKIPIDKFHVNLDRHGNTSAVAVAMALDKANREGRFQVRRLRILLVVFGGGLTYASSVIQWWVGSIIKKFISSSRKLL